MQKKIIKSSSSSVITWTLLTAVLLVLGFYHVNAAKAAPKEDPADSAQFDPFTLTTLNPLASSILSSSTEPSIVGINAKPPKVVVMRPSIRIPYRPALRSPYQPF